jgi:hypothetical protein
MSDIPEIKNKFRKSFDATVVRRTHKLEGVKASGKDTHNLLDIFDLIREHLVEEVQSMDSSQEELTNRLSEIEGDLYELRHSTDQSLKFKIKKSKEEIKKKRNYWIISFLFLFFSLLYKDLSIYNN